MSPGLVRMGLVGCGRLAEAGYLPAFAACAGAELIAVADPDPIRREIVAGALPAFSSLEELIVEASPEALLVASPPAMHEQGARAAAEAGIPALVEKPPAPDLAGAARIAELEPAPWLGFNRRFSLGSKLRGALPRGGGVELALRYRRFSWAPVSVRDPALIDLAPHLVDLALFAGLGEPTRVSARSRRADHVELRLESETGEATIHCACDRRHRERATVRGPDGEVVAEAKIGGVVRGARERLLPGPHPLVASLGAQLDEFARAARTGDAPTLATAADGAAAMRVIAAAAASLSRGGEPVSPDQAGVGA